jgi:hypothetical protein
MKIDAAHAELNATRTKTEEPAKAAEARPDSQAIDKRSPASLFDLIGREVRPALAEALPGEKPEHTLARDVQKWIEKRDFAITGAPLAAVAEARIEAGNLTPEAAKQKYAPLQAEMETEERIERLVLRRMMEKILGKDIARDEQQAQATESPDDHQSDSDEPETNDTGEVDLSL